MRVKERCWEEFFFISNFDVNIRVIYIAICCRSRNFILSEVRKGGNFFDFIIFDLFLIIKYLSLGMNHDFDL